MSIRIDILSLGGKLSPEETTTHEVSYWHIPGGYDYTRAEVRKVFFSDEDSANKFARLYEMPPEMAFVYEYKKEVLSEQDRQA